MPCGRAKEGEGRAARHILQKELLQEGAGTVSVYQSRAHPSFPIAAIRRPGSPWASRDAARNHPLPPCTIHRLGVVEPAFPVLAARQGGAPWLCGRPAGSRSEGGVGSGPEEERSVTSCRGLNGAPPPATNAQKQTTRRYCPVLLVMPHRPPLTQGPSAHPLSTYQYAPGAGFLIAFPKEKPAQLRIGDWGLGGNSGTSKHQKVETGRSCQHSALSPREA